MSYPEVSVTSSRPRYWGPALELALSCGLLAVVLAHAVDFHLRAEILPFDDAYITYRYAANLLAGHGLAYNVTERVFGTSTLLYTLWLALLKLSMPALEIPVLAVRGNGLFYVATVLLIFALGRRWLGAWLPAGLLASAFGISPPMLVVSSGGMETYLFLGLALGTVCALAWDRIRLAALLGSLCMLTRPEGAIVVGIWFADWLFLARRKRDLWALGITVAPLLLWYGFATLYYGTPIPHSVIAKNRPLYLLPPGFAWRDLLEHFIGWSGFALLGRVPDRLWIWLGLIPAGLSTLALTLPPAYARRYATWALPALFWLLVAFYALSNPLMFDWYYPTLYGLFLPLLALGPLSLLFRPGDKPAIVSRRGARAAAAVWITLALAMVAAQPLAFNLELWQRNRLFPQIATPDRQRVLAYRAVADRLNALSSPGTTVATPEVGALGYYFKGHVYDACGLVSPQALPFLPVALRERADGLAGAISTGFVEATQPDYVVSMGTFARKSIEPNHWFQASYDLVGKEPLPAELWGSQDVAVYARNAQSRADVAVDARAAWSAGIELKQVLLPQIQKGATSLPLTLIWAAGRPADRNWKVFVHLLNEQDTLVGQGDAYPDGGNAATSTWGRHDVIVDHKVLGLREPLAPGRYRVKIGFYDDQTGARLPLADGSDAYLLPQTVLVAD